MQSIENTKIVASLGSGTKLSCRPDARFGTGRLHAHRKTVDERNGPSFPAPTVRHGRFATVRHLIGDPLEDSLGKLRPRATIDFGFFTLLEHTEMMLSLEGQARRRALAKARRLLQEAAAVPAAVAAPGSYV